MCVYVRVATLSAYRCTCANVRACVFNVCDVCARARGRVCACVCGRGVILSEKNDSERVRGIHCCAKLICHFISSDDRRGVRSVLTALLVFLFLLLSFIQLIPHHSPYPLFSFHFGAIVSNRPVPRTLKTAHSQQPAVGERFCFSSLGALMALVAGFFLLLRLAISCP